jgi:hypothetical protein
MSAWKDLPNEILNLVFDILARDHYGQHSLKVFDLKQCQLTCKNWSEVAKRLLCETILIRGSDHLERLLTTLSLSKSNPGLYVKHIFIYRWDTAVEYLERLLLMCPNIEKLGGPPDANGDVFAQVRKAYENGACKHLVDTPMLRLNRAEANNEHYYNAL